jgi:hypothetical protein
MTTAKTGVKIKRKKSSKKRDDFKIHGKKEDYMDSSVSEGWYNKKYIDKGAESIPQSKPGSAVPVSSGSTSTRSQAPTSNPIAQKPGAKPKGPKAGGKG